MDSMESFFFNADGSFLKGCTGGGVESLMEIVCLPSQPVPAHVHIYVLNLLLS